jgi:Tfp pilus assembly protein PilF
MAHRHLRHARELNADAPAPHHAFGLLFELRGDPTEAERNYRAALKVDPGFFPARLNLGRLLYRRSAFDDARMEFSKLTLSAPEHLEAWCGLIQVLLRLDRTSDAEAALNAAVQWHGVVPPLVLLRARLALRDNRQEDALTLLSGLTADPDAETAALALAWRAVAKLRKGQTKQALADAQAALVLSPRGEIAAYVVRMVSEAERTPSLPAAR